ncbi:type II secretion system protein [bacterium]|nr:type II secretion system protein [bacterium]
MSILKNKKFGFTLTEISIAILIVGILTAVTLPVIRSQMGKSDEYSYYLAYKTVEKIGGQIAALGDPDYDTSYLPGNSSKIASVNKTKKTHKNKLHSFIATLPSKIANTELIIFKTLFPKAYADETVYENVFDESSFDDLKIEIDVCINNKTDILKSEAQGTEGSEDYVPAQYYTKEDFGCEPGTGTIDENGNMSDDYTDANMTSAQIAQQDILSLYSNSKCTMPSDKITTAKDDDGNDVFVGLSSAEVNSVRNSTAKQYCENIMATRCKEDNGDASNIIYEEETTEGGTDEDGDYDAETTHVCKIKVTYSTASSGFNNYGATYYPPAVSADACSATNGYYNMRNGAPTVTVNDGGTIKSGQATVSCMCDNNHPEPSYDNSRVCCQTPPSGYTAYGYLNTDNTCKTCKGDFNYTTETCCPDYSNYDAASNKCKCVRGFEMNEAETACVRTGDCPPGMKFDETAQACVPAPFVLEAKKLCNLVADNWNISSKHCDIFDNSSNKGSDGEHFYKDLYDAVAQKNSAYDSNVLNSINAKEGAFNSITPNIVFSNGLKMWILADRMASLPGLTFDPSITSKNQNICVDLDKATEGGCNAASGYFCGNELHCFTLANGLSDMTDARNCCSSFVTPTGEADNRAMAISGFVIYVDINGNKGDGTLWKDVFPFYVATTGRVFPGYPLDATGANVGGNNPAFLSSSVYYYKPDTSSRKREVVYSGISYAQAVCKAGIISKYAPYCLENNIGPVDGPSSNPCFSNKCYITVKKKHSFL